MAIKVVTVRKVVTVDTEEELRKVLRSIEPSDRGKSVVLSDSADPVETAISIAESFVEDFVPFTYEDVGLSLDKRNYRSKFRDWAQESNIEYRRVKTSGKSGSQGARFYPFKLDETGQKLMAAYPAEGMEP